MEEVKEKVVVPRGNHTGDAYVAELLLAKKFVVWLINQPEWEAIKAAPREQRRQMARMLGSLLMKLSSHADKTN